MELKATRTLKAGRWVKDPEGNVCIVVSVTHPKAKVHYVTAIGTTEMELVNKKDAKGKDIPGDLVAAAKEREFNVSQLTLVTNTKDIPASRR